MISTKTFGNESPRLMQPREVDRVIDRARRAYLRRSEFDGRAPRIADSDVIHTDGRERVHLCDGVNVLAIYDVRKDGSLRYLPGGKYERLKTIH